MDHPDPAVPPGKLIAHRPGAVLAAVVGQDELKVGKFLAQHTVHTAAEGGLGIVYGYDNRHARFHKTTPVPETAQN